MSSVSATARSATGGSVRGVLPVVLAGAFVTQLDFFIVNVAMPSLKADLHANWAATQWVATGYGLALACFLITAGRLGDLYGLRRVFVIGMVVFTLSSAACGLAPTIEVLLAARVVQGVAAAIVVPQVLGIVTTTYNGPSRARAFTAYGLAIGLAAVFGQLIGGALISVDVAGLGWRAIFLINVPIGLLTSVLAPRVVPECRGTGRARLDLGGVALATVGLLAIMVTMVEGRQEGWPPWTVYGLVVGVALLGGFVAYQRWFAARGGIPLVSLGLLRHRSFGVGLGIALFYMAAMGSFFFIFAMYLQQGRRLSALDSGLLVGFGGVAYLAASLVAGRLMAKAGARLLAVGGVLVAIGYGLLAVGTHGGSVAWLLPGLFVAGAGMGTVQAPMSAAVLADVPTPQAGSASGVLATTQQVGNALGVAVVCIVFLGVLGVNPPPTGYPEALQEGLQPLIAFCLVVAVLAQLLSKPRHTSGSLLK